MDSQPKSPVSVNHAQRNARTLDELLVSRGSQLRHQARRNSLSSADAEDALQEACIQFLRAYHGPLDRSRAMPWMMLVTKRCAWAIGRHRRRERPLEFHEGIWPEGDCPEPRGPETLAEVDAELSERWELLERLKPNEREALLGVGLGYSYKEIAQRNEWTYTKVNRCVSEGRAALREMAQRQR
jgi:RNA polymerase sigma factor (sigma-70 family)